MCSVFSENSVVVEVLDKEKPKDPRMQELLREYLYIVCTRDFTPIFRSLGTKENHVADFISRNHNQSCISSYFLSKDLPMLTWITNYNHTTTKNNEHKQRPHKKISNHAYCTMNIAHCTLHISPFAFKYCIQHWFEY